MNNCRRYFFDSVKPVCLLLALATAGGRPVSVVYAADRDELLDMPLEQLLDVEMEVVSASKFPQQVSEAPSAVVVLTADDIRTFGWRNLAEALAAVRGLNVRHDRKYHTLGNRGFLKTGDYNSRVLVTLDGRRMNDNIYDESHFGEDFLLDMEMIDRIEYVPGAGSSIYGANALLGVINIVTKKARDVGAMVGGEFGSFDTFRERGSFGHRFANGAEVLVNASHYDSAGPERLFYPEFADTHQGIAQDMDRERADKAFAKFAYRELTLEAGFVDRYKRVPTAAYGTAFNNPGFANIDQRAFVDVGYRHSFGEKLTMQARGFYQGMEYQGYYPYALPSERRRPKEALPEQYTDYDAASGRWWGGEISLIGTQFERHKWMVGLELQYDQRQRFNNYIVSPYVPLVDHDNNGERFGFYLQDEFRFAEDWLVNAGVRVDHHHLLDHVQVNPRIALIWHATRALTAKWLYSSAFRAPNSFEQDFSSPPVRLASPDSREEHIKSYEAVLEWQAGNGLRLLGSLFYNRMSDFLEQRRDRLPVIVYGNSGEFHVYGGELEIEKRWGDGRLLKLSWTHSEVRRDAIDGAWPEDSPRNLLKFHYAEPLFGNRFKLGSEFLFVDERKTLQGNLAGGYQILNLTLTNSRPWYGWLASLGVYNLLDQHYRMVAGPEHVQDAVAMNGLTFRLKLDYRF